MQEKAKFPYKLRRRQEPAARRAPALPLSRTTASDTGKTPAPASSFPPGRERAVRLEGDARKLPSTSCGAGGGGAPSSSGAYFQFIFAPWPGAS